MNQNNNQVQPSNLVSQEELAKTQVLNLSDVQEIAKFEKKTSKRPAALFAIAGLLAITLGFSYPKIMMAVDSIGADDTNYRVEESYEEEITPETEETPTPQVQQNTTRCTFSNPQNPDGTAGTAIYDLVFNENNQLQSYAMTLTLDPIQGNTAGLTAVQGYYNSYKALDSIPLNGYKIETTYTDTGMKVVVTVDLTTFDKNTLTDGHKGNYFANVPYNLGDAKDVIKQQLTANSYVCQ